MDGCFSGTSFAALSQESQASSSTPISHPRTTTQVVHSLSPVIPLAPPERFSGAPQKAQVFLTQCSLHFMCRPAIFPNAQSRVAFILSYLSGDAVAWSLPLVSKDSAILYDFEEFKKEFLRIFDRRPCPDQRGR